MIKLSNNVFGSVCETIILTIENIGQTKDELQMYDTINKDEYKLIENTVNLLFKKLISVGNTYLECVENTENNILCSSNNLLSLDENSQENKEDSICLN